MKTEMWSKRQIRIVALALAIVVIILLAGIWVYRNHRGSAQPVVSSSATSSYELIYPNGDATQELGMAGDQFKVQYVGVMQVPVSFSGQCGTAPDYFNQYFDESGVSNSWCYPNLDISPQPGDTIINLVVPSLTYYFSSSVPPMTLSYPVYNEQAATTTYVSAPIANSVYGQGWLTFTPLGSDYPTARMGFAVPQNTTSAILDYPGGELTLDFQNKSMTLASGSLTGDQGSISVNNPPPLFHFISATQYGDPSGVFAMTYPSSFNVSDSPGQNGGTAIPLSNVLAEFDSPYGTTNIPGTANDALSSIIVSDTPALNMSSCENSQGWVAVSQNPGNSTYWYTSYNFTPAPTNGVGSIDDEYQTDIQNVCWGIDFSWMTIPGHPMDYQQMNAVEQSVLSGFTVINAQALSTSGS